MSNKAFVPWLLILSLSGAGLASAEQSMGQPRLASEACSNPDNAPANRCSGTVSAAFGPNGTLWQAWAQNGYVYVQSSTDQGQNWSAASRVNATAEPVRTHGESRPNIKVGPEGQIYLSWDRELEKRYSGHVRFSRSTDGGRTFSAPLTVNTNQDMIGHRYNDLAVGPDGKVVIFWMDARDAEAEKKLDKEVNASSLYYAWSDDDGATFHVDARVSGSTCQCCRIQSDIDPDGLPTVIWRHVFPGSIRDHALLHFSALETPGPLKQVSRQGWEIDACPHHGPGFSIGRDGRYHAVWFTNSDTARGLFYASSKDRGEHFSEPLPFGDYEQGASHPDVLAVDGRAYLAWMEFDGSENHVRVMRSSDNGQSFGPVETLYSSAGEADSPFLIGDRGKVYVSWHIPEIGYHVLPVE